LDIRVRVLGFARGKALRPSAGDSVSEDLVFIFDKTFEKLGSVTSSAGNEFSRESFGHGARRFCRWR
jgi:hypothetical protein